jgi:hypothetical protein
MQNYELTFVHLDDDRWTWRRQFCRDFHEAMLQALLQCPDNCRVLRIERIPEGK